jgi:hypothetical protein
MAKTNAIAMDGRPFTPPAGLARARSVFGSQITDNCGYETRG